MSVCGKHLQRVLSLIPLLILLASNLSAQKITLAVVDLEGIGISQTEAVALSNRLRNELFRLGAFKVVDRGMMQEILDEQTLQLSGCTSNECLVEVGRLLGVQQMVGGSISKIGTLFSVSTRLVDVETGEVLNVSDYDIDGGLEDVLRSGMKEVAETLSKTLAQPGTEPIENITQSGNESLVTEILEEEPEVIQNQPNLARLRKLSHLELHIYGGLGNTVNIVYNWGRPIGIGNRFQLGLQIGRTGYFNNSSHRLYELDEVGGREENNIRIFIDAFEADMEETASAGEGLQMVYNYFREQSE